MQKRQIKFNRRSQVFYSPDLAGSFTVEPGLHNVTSDGFVYFERCGKSCRKVRFKYERILEICKGNAEEVKILTREECFVAGWSFWINTDKTGGPGMAAAYNCIKKHLTENGHEL